MTWTWPRAAGAGADADGRDAQPLGDGGRQLLGHELEHDREGARFLDGERVGEQRARRSRSLPWTRLAAQAVTGLRRPADVAHDRDAGSDDASRWSAPMRTPPSTLTAWAPPSRMKRPAFSSASSVDA